MARGFMIAGTLAMAIGVAAGAFGAHALRAHFEEFPNLQSTYDTAVRYHMIHGLALFVVAWASTRWPGTWTNLSGYLLIAGIFLFSGSLYMLSLFNLRWMGAIAPLGGTAFIAGWLSLAAGVLRS